MLEAEVTPSGDVVVEGQHVGQLNGFRFTADPAAAGEAAKALNAAALKALASEIEGRAGRVSEAVDEAFILANDGIIRWLGEPIGKLTAGAHVLEPRVTILADEQLTGQALEMVQRRLDLWLAQHVKKLLGPLKDLENGEGLEGMARGIAFHVAESLGVLDRTRVADDVKNLSQDARATLRKFGIRFGAYHLYLPGLIKPAPRALAAQLYALKRGGETFKGLDEVLHLAASGRTSLIAGKDVQRNLYRAAGFRVCGDRAVRVDILERLADLIRPAVSYRPGVTLGDPSPGAADGDGFVVTVAMTSLAGCSGDSFASILRALGYVSEHRKGPAITVPLLAAAAAEPHLPHEADLAQAPASGKDVSSGPEVNAPPQEPLADAGQPADTAMPAVPEAISQAGGSTPLDAVAAAASGLEASETPQDQPDATEAANSVEPAAEEPLIEIWRPHRQQHSRRPEARTRKKPFERHARASAGGCAATTPEPVAQDAAPREAVVGQPPASSGTGDAVLAQDQAGSPRKAFKGRHKDSGDRGAGEPGQRFGGHRGRRQGGGQARGNPDERKEGSGERFAVKEKRLSDRPPDPDSPFAKLLVLKARLEEKTRQEKDNPES